LIADYNNSNKLMQQSLDRLTSIVVATDWFQLHTIDASAKR